ncbi:MAG: ABC transporter substrate-binding protein [Chloroflexi bacterium]|nr:ABC transporter substrate-binding protein [Chloroflexota bacterium]
MVSRHLQVLIGLGVVASMLLLSCAPAAAPAPKAAPKAAPTSTVAAAPTAKPAAAAPAATPKPAPTVAARPVLPPGADPEIYGGTPVYGGILTVTVRDNPVTFDVHTVATASVMSTPSGSYNQMLGWDYIDHNKLVGDLAKKWEVSADGLTYTFYLEENVKWHDGAPFSAEDVRYSLMREKNPPQGVYIFARAYFDAMETVEAVDKNTVKVKMNRPKASFPTILTTVNSSILPKHILEKQRDMKLDVVGTGPWKLKRFDSGVAMEFVKNPDYFKKGLPYMDGRIAYIIQDPTTRLSAFRTGRVHMDAGDHEPPAIDTIEATMKDTVRAWRVPGVTTTQNPFIVQNKPPFNDVRVRQAVTLALDKYEFVKVINPGFFGVGGFMPPGGPWALSDEELGKQIGYAKTGPAKDAERAQAKKVLAEAGFPNGLDFELETRTAQEYTNVAVWMKDQFEKVGMRASIKPVESAAYYDHLTKSSFQIMSSANGLDADDPDIIFGMTFLKDSGKNYGKFYSAEFDKMFDQQSTSLDAAKRKEIVRQMQLLLHKEVPYPVLGWKNRTLGVWKKVKNYAPWTNNARLGAVGRHEYTWLDPNLPPK